MNAAAKPKLAKDGNGWGVQTLSPLYGWLFENQQPMTRTEAEALLDALSGPSQWEATQRYWAQESFGA